MAKTWDTTIITDSLGIAREAQSPVIISASRSTDIPAFYSDWFFHRLNMGYSVWTNPFNGVRSYVSYSHTRFIVFWSKNPAPLIKHLSYLKEKGIGCYIQFTLNNYDDTGLERGVPPLQQRIDTFKRLSDMLGKEAVIWRFDPLILTPATSAMRLIEKMDYVARRVKDYTDRLVFSFADISTYKRVASNLNRNHVDYIDWTEEHMLAMASLISEANGRDWNLDVSTCGEQIDLQQFGISHSRCIDDRLIARLAYRDHKLMSHLGMKIMECPADLFGESTPPSPHSIKVAPDIYAVPTHDNRDKGQREHCRCAKAKDIGNYNTCPHLCEYCYANYSKEIAIANWRRHLDNPYAESII